MKWFFKRSREEDLDRELRSHLEAEALERREAGATPEEARWAERRALGNGEAIKENVRGAWGWESGWGWVERVRQDVRFALPGFRKTPGFAAVVIGTLSLGIGANTAIFSVVDAVFWRPLPYHDAKRLVVVWLLQKHHPDAPPFFAKYPDFVAFQSGSRTLDNVAAATWAVGGRVFSGHGAAREVLAMPVSIHSFRYWADRRRWDDRSRAGQVRMGVLRRAMRLALSGAALGDVVWDGGERPVDVCRVVTLLFVVALVAAYVPARRASRIEPMAALRSH